MTQIGRWGKLKKQAYIEYDVEWSDEIETHQVMTGS